jgi:hypothetical protein
LSPPPASSSAFPARALMATVLVTMLLVASTAVAMVAMLLAASMAHDGLDDGRAYREALMTKQLPRATRRLRTWMITPGGEQPQKTQGDRPRL